MTFRVHFYAEQAFLARTRAMLENRQVNEEPETSALCILACAAAIEAFANRLLTKAVRFRHFDELKIASKIEYLLLHGGTEPNWGAEPWQSIGQLFRSRNWLAHYKEHDIGLINSKFEWLTDSHNRSPKIDPYKELTFAQSRKYYDQTRRALLVLARSAGAGELEFDFLLTERYEPFLIG